MAVNFHKQNRQSYLANKEAFIPHLNHALYLHTLEQNHSEAMCVHCTTAVLTHGFAWKGRRAFVRWGWGWVFWACSDLPLQLPLCGLV